MITNSPIIRKRKNKLAVATTITADSLLAAVLVVSMPIQSAHAVCVPSPNALHTALVVLVRHLQQTVVLCYVDILYNNVL